MRSQNNAVLSLHIQMEQRGRHWVTAFAAILVGAVAAVNLSAQTTELNTKLVTSPDHFLMWRTSKPATFGPTLKPM